jgi:hypothetical protein
MAFVPPLGHFGSLDVPTKAEPAQVAQVAQDPWANPDHGRTEVAHVAHPQEAEEGRRGRGWGPDGFVIISSASPAWKKYLPPRSHKMKIT